MRERRREGEEDLEGKKENGGEKRGTKMSCVVQNNSMVKSFPQQAVNEMKADASARLFK